MLLSLALAIDEDDDVATLPSDLHAYPRFAISVGAGEMRIYRFESAKDPSEKVVLTFDFSKDLDDDETLTGTPAISIISEKGVDTAPNSIKNGAPDIDDSGKKWLIPIKGGQDDSKYHIKITTSTTNPFKSPSMAGILTVTTF